MAQVKFASKTGDGIEEYKNILTNGINYCIELGIIENEIGNRFISKLENQTSYIPREDVMNLEENCKFIENKIELVDYTKRTISNIDKNKNPIEKIYETISIIHDIVIGEQEKEKTKEKINKINEMKELQELENKKEIIELEKLLDAL